MKCSLLTLSTYIDGELAPDRRADLDAHLVGCPRCSAGAATLREEKARLGRLARVRVAPASARLMLEQVGIIGADADLAIPPRAAQPDNAPPPEQQPWQSARTSPALPWTPRRPAPPPPPIEEMPVPPVGADVQPDLPFDTTRDQRARAAAPAQIPAAATAMADMRPAPTLASELDTAPATRPAAPPPAAPSDRGWDIDPGEHVPRPAHAVDVPPAAVPPPPPMAAPTRVAATGASMVWSRLRDAVAVRMTLARGGDSDDSMQIVSGATRPRGMRLPPAEIADPAPSTAEAVAATAAAEAAGVELTGLSGVGRPAAARHPAEALVATPGSERPAAPGRTQDVRSEAPNEPVSWNAFGASSYPPEDVADAPAPAAPQRPRSLGRHGRAAARDSVDVATRLRSALAAAGAQLQDGGQRAAIMVRRAVAAGRASNPDRRIIAAIAAVAVIFLTALVVGHRPAATTGSTATTPSTSAPAHPSAPAASAHAPTLPPATTTTPVTVLTVGGGGSGFQVRDIRYGQQTGYMRLVFDIGPVTGNTGTSPKITVASNGPTTLLVTLDGTVPAGSTGSPPASSVISSVTLVSSGGGKSVYRIVVTRAVTATGFLLSGTSPPLRFVLDLH